YDRYTSAAASGAVYTVDRRVPLPSLWAARYIQGGTAAFNTDFKIWREGLTNTSTACAGSGSGNAYIRNNDLVITSIVRFDEHENSMGFGNATNCSPCGPGGVPPLPETSRTSSASGTYPAMLGSDLGGWMFLNLSNNSQSVSLGTFPAYTEQRLGFGPGPINTRGGRTTSQNWVVVSMFAAIGANRLSVDFD